MNKPHEKQTILAVDDEPANLQILSNLLKNEYNILVAKSGKQAIARLNTNNIDLVLLDIIMPDMDGYEVLQIIKSDQKLLNIPIIFISAKTETHDEVQGLLLGAVDYITKPFQPEIVQIRVRTHTALQRKTRLLEQIANMDGLTELCNRRKFDEYFQREWDRAQRSKKPLTVIMIDVDFFKNYNDNVGHQMGDECLRKVATSLKASADRSSDIVARYGGEEFVILAPETDINGAKAIANRCVENAYNLNIKHPQSEVSEFVTISVGAVCIDSIEDESPNCEQLLSLADIQLYNVKRTTRNNYQTQNIKN